MEDEMANLRLDDEEEDAFEEDAEVTEQDPQFSLVGTCLTDNVFLEYNTRISSLGLQQYMQIKVHLDVRLALKQNRRSVLGLNSFKATVNGLMKLGSDASTRGGPARVSRWLRELDGTSSRNLKKERGSVSRKTRDVTRNLGPTINYRFGDANEGILTGFNGVIQKGFRP
ncbi:hypothetical protein Goshw_030343 [Gossypium schwendimanii]|uniref:Uncharacterized protein n=1 Tax=Gossypium schwendimanii TaxID=34291 RepID=A0A7J9MW68_GOSSC|nr:hypothetical protein [Gossypium schwendimanii]